MPEWTTMSLRDAATWHSGGTPNTAINDYWGGDIPWISAASMKNFFINSSDRCVTALGLTNGTRLVPAGTTVFVVRGMSLMTEFRVGIAQRDVAFGQDCKALVPREGIDPYFLAYAVKARSEEILNMVEAAGHGTGRLPTDRIGALSLSVPGGRDEQRAAVAPIRALDDKIAVNDRTHDLVDQLCAAELDQILTATVNMSEVRLGDIASINLRKVTPTSGQIRYIDISSVSAGSIQWPELTPWANAPGRARRGVAPGDTIWSTVRPGRRSFALLLDSDPSLVASTGFAVLTPEKVGPAFLYEITRREEFVQYLESVAEGSAYPAVRSERFAQAVIPLPPLDALERFEAAAMALRLRQHAAQRESRTLAALRDTLLPRLMSGEMRVRDVEEIVEGAT